MVLTEIESRLYDPRSRQGARSQNDQVVCDGFCTLRKVERECISRAASLLRYDRSARHGMAWHGMVWQGVKDLISVCVRCCLSVQVISPHLNLPFASTGDLT